MAHTKEKDLKDLSAELEQLRTWEFLKEKSPGIFYFKSIPFLHFHDKDGERWADVKIRGEWERIAIDFNPPKKAKMALLTKAKEAHKLLLSK